MPRAATQVKQPSTAQLAARAAGAERLKAARKRVAPAVIRKETVASAEQVDAGVATPGVGAEVNNPVQEVEVAVMPSKEKLDVLRFMAEIVRVQIHETAEEQADPRFSVWVNGREQVFVRGQEFSIPRYFVEGLARAKPIGYTNQEYIMPDGSRSVRWPTKRGLRYGFSVLEDPSGQRGRDWLAHVLKEP